MLPGKENVLGNLIKWNTFNPKQRNICFITPNSYLHNLRVLNTKDSWINQSLCLISFSLWQKFIVYIYKNVSKHSLTKTNIFQVLIVRYLRKKKRSSPWSNLQETMFTAKWFFTLRFKMCHYNSLTATCIKIWNSLDALNN